MQPCTINQTALSPGPDSNAPQSWKCNLENNLKEEKTIKTTFYAENQTSPIHHPDQQRKNLWIRHVWLQFGRAIINPSITPLIFITSPWLPCPLNHEGPSAFCKHHHYAASWRFRLTQSIPARPSYTGASCFTMRLETATCSNWYDL